LIQSKSNSKVDNLGQVGGYVKKYFPFSAMNTVVLLTWYW